MNKSCLKVNNKYFAVMSDDGIVRVLSKNNPYNTDTVQFLKFAGLEDYLEELETQEHELYKELNALDDKTPSAKTCFGVALAVAILVLCGGYFGLSSILKGAELARGLGITAIYSILFPFSAATTIFFGHKIDNWGKKRSLRAEIEDNKKKIKLAKDTLVEYRKEINVERVVLPEMSMDTMKQINAIIEKDETSAKVNQEKQQRILRNVMNSFFEDNNIPEEDRGKIKKI